MNDKQRKQKQRADAKIKECKAFLDKMKKSGVVASIQFVMPSGYCAHLTSMPVPAALGSLRHAILISEKGVRDNQAFDSFVQAMEQRSDLVERFKKVLSVK